METNADIIGTVLMYLCLYGLILCGVAIFFATVGGPVLDALRRWLHLDGFGRVCVAVFVCGVSYMGMTKHGTVQHPGRTTASPWRKSASSTAPTRSRPPWR